MKSAILDSCIQLSTTPLRKDEGSPYGVDNPKHITYELYWGRWFKLFWTFNFLDMSKNSQEGGCGINVRHLNYFFIFWSGRCIENMTIRSYENNKLRMCFINNKIILIKWYKSWSRALITLWNNFPYQSTFIFQISSWDNLSGMAKNGLPTLALFYKNCAIVAG